MVLARVSETEEGRNGRERLENTYRSLPQRPSSTTAYGGGPPSPQGKVKELPLRGSWQGAALTEEGRSGRERLEKGSQRGC